MHRHGFYWRWVTLASGARERSGVHRFLCTRCGRTVSCLPDFCVPYKHFSADVIHGVLAAVLLMALSFRAVAHWDSVYNRAGFSRYCVGEWLAHFRRNSHNLWHFGLRRLGLSAGDDARTCATLFIRLQCFGAARSGDVAQSLRAVQCALSSAYPPFGLFRAQLLPGCFT